MSNPVTHLYVETTSPNESDTQGDGYILCGQEVVEKFEQEIRTVTCKRCIKRHLKMRGKP